MVSLFSKQNIGRCQFWISGERVVEVDREEKAFAVHAFIVSEAATGSEKQNRPGGRCNIEPAGRVVIVTDYRPLRFFFLFVTRRSGGTSGFGLLLESRRNCWA